MKNNSLAWVDKLGKDDVVKLMSYAEELSPEFTLESKNCFSNLKEIQRESL